MKALYKISVFLLVFFGCNSQKDNDGSSDNSDSTKEELLSCSDTVFTGDYIIRDSRFPAIGINGPEPESFLNKTIHFSESCLAIDKEIYCNISYEAALDDTFWIFKKPVNIQDVKRYEILKELGWDKPYVGVGHYIHHTKSGSCEPISSTRVYKGATYPDKLFIKHAFFIYTLSDDSIIVRTSFGEFLAVKNDSMKTK